MSDKMTAFVLAIIAGGVIGFWLGSPQPGLAVFIAIMAVLIGVRGEIERRRP
jgi:uncharacterized membrane protein